MAREVLRQLEDTVERLLRAGAGLCASDAELVALEAQLGALGAHSPALAKLAEAVRRTLAARAGAAASRELLQLAVLLVHVRGALVQPADGEGPVRALPDAPPVSNPLSAEDALELAEALRSSSFGRLEHALARYDEPGASRDDLRDLRLLPVYVEAMDNPAARFALTEKVVPHVATAMAPAIRAQLDLAGGATDAMRLRVLARADGRNSVALLERAAVEGSDEVAGAALGLLQGHESAALERTAVAVLAAGRSVHVRAMLANALSLAGSPGALPALLALLGDESPDVARAAATFVEKFPLAAVEAAVRAVLALDWLGVAAEGAPGARRPPQGALAVVLERDLAARQRLGAGLITAIERTMSARDVPFLLAVFRGTSAEALREAAARALLATGATPALEVLVAEGEGGTPAVRDLAIRASFALGPRGAVTQLGRLFTPDQLAAPGVEDALRTALGAMRDVARTPTGAIEPAWLAGCVAVFERPALKPVMPLARDVAFAICSRVAHRPEPGYAVPVAALLGVRDDARWYAVPVVLRLGGPAALDVLLTQMGITATALRGRVATLLKDLPFEKSWFEFRCIAVDRNRDAPLLPAQVDALREALTPRGA